MRLDDYAASGNCYKVRLALAQPELHYERIPAIDEQDNWDAPQPPAAEPSHRPLA